MKPQAVSVTLVVPAETPQLAVRLVLLKLAEVTPKGEDAWKVLHHSAYETEEQDR